MKATWPAPEMSSTNRAARPRRKRPFGPTTRGSRSGRRPPSRKTANCPPTCDFAFSASGFGWWRGPAWLWAAIGRGKIGQPLRNTPPRPKAGAPLPPCNRGLRPSPSGLEQLFGRQPGVTVVNGARVRLPGRWGDVLRRLERLAKSARPHVDLLQSRISGRSTSSEPSRRPGRFCSPRSRDRRDSGVCWLPVSVTDGDVGGACTRAFRFWVRVVIPGAAKSLGERGEVKESPCRRAKWL